MREHYNLCKRNSSIELLKVIAIVLIVISHTVQTLNSSFDVLSFDDYVLDYSIATTNIQYLILAVIRYSGALGNTIFFVCSAWFLIDDDRTNYRKMFNMIVDVWILSVMVLLFVSCFCGIQLNLKMTIKQLFPNYFANNWYITCYILFYLFHSYVSAR